MIRFTDSNFAWTTPFTVSSCCPCTFWRHASMTSWLFKSHHLFPSNWCSPVFSHNFFFLFPKNLQLRETGWTPIYDNEITQQFRFENGASFWNCRILDAMTRDTEKEKFNVLFARKKYKKLQSWWKSISCIFIIRAHKAVCCV